MKNKLAVWVLAVCAVVTSLSAQTTEPADKKDIRFNFDAEGKRYIRLAITNQVWVRFNESNPGTMVNSLDKPQTFDIGLRRIRLQLMGQVHKNFFVYIQFGINNFNSLAARKVGDFFHDALVEYTPVKIMSKKDETRQFFTLSFGAGLTGFSGPSRFSSPGVASFLGIDAPIYQQTTNDATDQFLRKLSVYTKGKLWKLDYRFILTDPMTITTSSLYNPNISQYANFSPIGRSIQTSAYVALELFDQESNQIPYSQGTYHGTKKVLNIGIGYQYQKDAMWYSRTGTDTSFNDMFILGADVFYDTPLGKDKDMAFSFYGAYNYMNYGPGYLRQIGTMNPGQTVAAGTPTVNGTGSAYPMLGTGHCGYVQTGFMLPKKWFGKGKFTMMPYFSAQVAKWDRLNNVMATFDTGLNFLFDGHKYKMTINYQNRPIFNNTTFDVMQRNSMVNFQFQIAI